MKTFLITLTIILSIVVLKAEIKIKLCKDRTNGKYELPSPCKSKCIKTYNC
jgi:hypothetical protein